MSTPAPIGAITAYLAASRPTHESVLLVLPCPHCRVDVEWIGAKVDGTGDTKYRFGEGCECK